MLVILHLFDLENAAFGHQTARDAIYLVRLLVDVYQSCQRTIELNLDELG